MSFSLLLIRHGLTRWNQQGRIQGHTDVDLCPQGREALDGLRPPPPWRHGRCFRSPLQRARHTARLLGIHGSEPVVALTEMSWGEWEGATLAELRRRHGHAMARNEALGLDFRPTGGESPREVVQRLQQWVLHLPQTGAACAITHKGVIRAMLALATGWDMTSDFPQRLHWDAGHAFSVQAGQARVQRLNVALRRDGD